MRLFLFILFFIILYNQGLATRWGVPEELIKVLLMVLPVVFLFLKAKWLRVAPGLPIVCLYVLWAVISSVLNGEGLLQGLMYSRDLVIGYLILLGIYNSYFDIKSIRTINRTILLLFFLQVGAAIFEILFLERWESRVGTMYASGGGIATTFPIFAFCFFFSGYLIMNKLKYLIIGASFTLVGYASGKLGIYFLIPILALIGYFLYSKLEKRSIMNKQTLSILVGLFVFAFMLGIILPSADSRTENLNLDNLSVIDRIEAFVSFSEKDNQMIVDDYTISRNATSMRIIEETFKRPLEVFLFGQGFSAYQAMGHMIGEGAFEEYRIVYGIVGWSYDALVIGWPGMFLHFLFFLLIFSKTLTLYRKTQLNRFGKTIVFACLLNFVTFLVNYFFYNYSFTVGGWIICTHLYFTGLMLAPQYRSFITEADQKLF